MCIHADLLMSFGATAHQLAKREVVFSEGDIPRYFHQVLSGEVRMLNTSHDGKEFVQGIFKEGQSFGEPPLFLGVGYPANAVVTRPASVIKLPAEGFFDLMEKHPEVKLDILRTFARRIYSKALSSRDIILHNPEGRILAFLESCKAQHHQPDGRVRIELTRQDIANCTGLRVETVIRTIRSLHDQKKVEIQNRKIFY